MNRISARTAVLAILAAFLPLGLLLYRRNA